MHTARSLIRVALTAQRRVVPAKFRPGLAWCSTDASVASNGDAAGPEPEDLVPGDDEDVFIAGGSGAAALRSDAPYRKSEDRARRGRRGARPVGANAADNAFQRWRREEARFASVEAPYSVSEPRLRMLFREYAKMQDGSVAAASDQAELPVQYCICCHHGTDMLRVDNSTLLSQFVADNGTILPKRLTKLCAKHQRAMARTIKRARSLNLLPYHSKLHPRLRFTSLTPDPASEKGGAAAKAAAYGGDRADASAVGGASPLVGESVTAALDGMASR